MPAVSTIALSDHVPVVHTFSPTAVSQRQTSFVERGFAATPTNDPTLTIYRRMNTTKTARTVEARLAVPVEVVAEDGTISAPNVVRFTGTFVCPTGITSTNFQAAVAMATDLLGETVFRNLVNLDDTFY